MFSYKPLWVAIIPAVVVGVIFEMFLGHRHDYTGHYAAGYGATFGVAMFWMRIIPAERYLQLANRGIVPLCVGCILLGVVTEATIFRIAKFDEIDFCNQSVGAVLAALCAMAFIGAEKPTESQLSYGLIVGILFLGVGGCFAVA
jgi:hypothetical protein